jgi:hypothetical protein
MGLGSRFLYFSSLGSSLCVVFLGVVFVWTSILPFFFLVPLWDVFHLFIYEGVLQDNNVFSESSTNNTSPKLILPKKPNKPKSNSRGADTIVIFTNPTKT